MPFESLLECDLIMGAAKDPDVVAIRAQPETFRWVDGDTGRRRRYTPDFLVTLRDGSSVYREVKSHAVLAKDPELRGRRRRIEIECLARGAGFEVWTEHEIRPTLNGLPGIRAATLDERALYSGAIAARTASSGIQRDVAPDRVRELASLIPMLDLRRVNRAWIGRSGLTGILTVLPDGTAQRRDAGGLRRG